jgi:glycosyltransferase involved in cell wall biosynthesis
LAILLPSETRRVLFVTYTFPPVGGAGVQRVTKFLKYLPRHGWVGSVLTVSNPSVPVFDESLAADVPKETRVVRARTLEPGYGVKRMMSAGEESAARPGRWLPSLARAATKSLLHPDPQILWAPAAIRDGSRFLREERHDAVIASGPPFSCFVIGARLAARAGLPLVLDFRDEWDLWGRYQENRSLGPLTRRVHRTIQSRVIRAAAALVATTQASASALEGGRARAGSRACVRHIYNGFDPDDFANATPALAPTRPRLDGDRYRLVYAGTLWRMTSVEPLVTALQRVAQTDPAGARRMELIVVGRRTMAQDALLSPLEGGPVRLVRQPYLDHGRVRDLLDGASRLVVLLSDLGGADRILPAKVFEYLASGRPILAVAPLGELTGLLAPFPQARCFAPTETEALAEFLAADLRSPRASERAPARPDLSRFERGHQAEELASLLDAICGG